MSVAVGDIFIKKAAVNSSFTTAITSKWVVLGISLYFVQIVLFTWMFVKGWDLSIVGIMQTVFYALVILTAGHLVFKESLNTMQIVGLSLALIGILITNLASR